MASSNGQALAVVRGEHMAMSSAMPLDFSSDQRQLIRDTFCNGASDSEFEVLMEVARARRLNPLFKHIYFVKRYDSQKKREVWSTQVSIDGLRTIAERTGKYDGQDEPEYIIENGRLICAKVRVYRKDWTRPAVGVAFFDEYAQKTREGGLTAFWRDKPHVMLAKCAESLAMRKAFPEDMSGLYTPEEMGAVERVTADVVYTGPNEPSKQEARDVETTIIRAESSPQKAAPVAPTVDDQAVALEQGLRASLAQEFARRIRAAGTVPLLDVVRGEVADSIARKLLTRSQVAELTKLRDERIAQLTDPEYRGEDPEASE